MENLKIRVHTEQQAKKAIELAEKLGYKERYPKSFNLTDGYVCLYDDKDIFKVCIAHAGSGLNKFKEISMVDLSLMANHTPQHKEYLDPHNNYELIEVDCVFMVQDHWIAVPSTANYLYKDNEHGNVVFTALEMGYPDSSIVWQRDTQPEALPLIDDDVSGKTAWDTQVGGNHYKQFKIQPMEYALKNKLDFAQSNVVKYVTRHAEKNGKADLLKAKHYIDLMIEHYYGGL